MRLLSNIERRASIRLTQEYILKLLKYRFENLPESLVGSINQIEDLAQLEQLHLETIKVNSVAEFEQLVKESLDKQNESTIDE
jgi:hypothetical protein